MGETESKGTTGTKGREVEKERGRQMGEEWGEKGERRKRRKREGDSGRDSARGDLWEVPS